MCFCMCVCVYVCVQKRISEGETKLKQQQNLYEAVRADRNLYSKNLIEAQDEIQVSGTHTRKHTHANAYTHTHGASFST